MRIVSWNVNGLRAMAKKEHFQQFVSTHSPTVLCLQETKGKVDQLMASSYLPSDYHLFWNSATRSGYSGTAIFTKIPPKNVWTGLQHADATLFDDEGRVISAEFDKFVLVNVYSPNTGNMPLRLPFRVEWDKQFLNHVNHLRKSIKKPVVILGDLNVALTPIDLARPAENNGSSGFTEEEREGLQRLLDSGFVDTFRFLKGDIKDCYTYWDYRMRARRRNVGWRIDYVLVEESIKHHLQDAFILGDVMGSDHCPVGIDLKVGTLE